MAEGEIARFDQILFLSQCFQKSSAAEASESVCMWGKGLFIYLLVIFQIKVTYLVVAIDREASLNLDRVTQKLWSFSFERILQIITRFFALPNELLV